MERWKSLTQSQKIGIIAAALVMVIVAGLLIFGGDDDLEGTAGANDNDNDGIVNEQDACPDEAGPASTNGCPDNDSDGIPNAQDTCPDTANDNVGDPCNLDEDGDTIPDTADTCPNYANDGIGDPCNEADNAPPPTEEATPVPTEAVPTEAPPTEAVPTEAVPTEAAPTEAPTEVAPTEAPTEPGESAGTEVPTEAAPTEAPTEVAPTEVAPTEAPTEAAPTEEAPTEAAPTEAPTQEVAVVPPDLSGVAAGAAVVAFDATIGANGAVVFTNNSEGDAFQGFSWNFGDGSAASTETSPTHNYLNPGAYTVALTATLSDGRTLTASRTVTLTEQDLPTVTCDFEIAVVGQAGPPYTLPLTVQFVNESENITSYLWTFEDNTTSTDATPANRTYANPGSYPIRLDCVSPRGNLSASGNVNATQSGGGSQTFRAGFTASPGSGEAPLNVQFTDTSVGAVSWSWTFGDGGTSTDQNPLHSYTTVGVFNITLVVTNAAGLTATATGTVETVPALARPIADFSVTPNEGNAPLVVTISPNVTGGAVTTYEWNFGNGQTSNQAGPHTITYSAAGTYTISLTVNGPGGGSNRTKQVLVTTPGDRVAAIFSYRLGDTLPEGKQVCFENASTGVITAQTWTFGDGSPSSTEVAPCHIYAADGSYTVTLAVTGEDGTSSTASQTVPVVSADVAPIAIFTAQPLTARVGDTINFTDQSTGVINTWAWDFGDGGTSSDRNPTHVYTTNGVYTVTLRVTGPGGTSQAATSSITVERQPLTCSINGTSSPLLLQTVNYTSSLGNRGSRTVTTYRWTMGSTDISSTTSASYQFTQSGAVVLTLYVQLDDGTECTTTKNISVNTSSFTCSVTAPSGALLGQAVVFDGVVNNVGGRPVVYTWALNGTTVASTEDYSFSQTTAGTYTVTFQATIDGVSCNIITKTITVSGNGIGDCKINGGSSTPLLNSTHSFTSGVNNPANHTLTYTWRLVGPAGSGIDITSTTQNFSNYQFTVPGTYTLTLTITPSSGTGCTVNKTITVNQNALTCTIDQGAGTITVGGTSNYRVSVSGTVTGTTYAWSNGGTTRTVTYNFNTTGPQTVSVVVRATSNGFTVECTATKTVTVNAVNTDITCEWSGPQLVLLGATANYDGSVGNLNAVTGRTATYRWLVNGAEVGTAEDLSYVFASTGSFTVRFEATASDGKTCSRQRTVNIKEQSLAANANPNAGIAPLTVNFTGISTGIYPNSYVWDFPGGAHAYTQNTTYRFDVPGEYTIVLHGRGDLGDMDASVIVRVGSSTNIRAEFTPSRWNGVAPMEVCYTDQSAGDQINSWSWDLNGDGTPDSTSQNPCFTYTTTGTFDVTLHVTNVFGLEASATNRIRTYALSESDSSFGVQLNPNGEVCFTSYLSSGTSLTSWDFGDGGTSTDLNPCHTYTESREYTVTMLVNAQGIPGAIVRRVNVDVTTSQELPDLRVEGICSADGSATFTIYNDGGDMPNPDTYRITDAAGVVVRTGDFQLGEDESLPITVNVRGVLNFTTTDSQLTASTECRKPTKLKVEGYCDEIDNAGAYFIVTNVDGGPMDSPMSYTISGASLPTPITGTFQLDGDANNEFRVDVPDGYGPLLFEASDGTSTLVSRTDCAENPDVTVEGRCKEEHGFSGTYFLLTNNGGAMVTPVSYTVTDAGGAVVDQGNFLLAEAGAPNFANTYEIFLSGIYGTLTFNAPDLNLTTNSVCAQPPKLEASGVCTANDLTTKTVVFTVRNTGGDMPDPLPYVVVDGAGNPLPGGTGEVDLAAGAETPITLTLDAGYGVAILSVGDGALSATASVEECDPNINDLVITSLCSENWLESRVWEIRNPNSFDVPFTWVLTETGETGTGTIPANSSTTVTTSATPGSNTLRVSVNNEEVAVASSRGPCNAALAVKGECSADGLATFIVTNTGYPMIAAQPYYVVNIMTEVASGTVPALGRGETFTVTVPGWYDSLTFRTGFSTPDAQGQQGLSAEVTTECAEPPRLTYSADCLEDGHAQFTITNEGGDMPTPSTYRVVDSSGTEVASGVVDLDADEVLTVEITDTFGTLTLTVDNFVGSVTTTCYEPPNLTYDGECKEDGSALFTVTNTGGDMNLGNQSITYEVLDANDVIITAGTINLAPNQTLQIPVVGTYGPLRLEVTNDHIEVATTECYEPYDLVAAGICKVNGAAEFTVTNNGGDMNLGNQTEVYEVRDSSDTVIATGTLALGEGESTTILVEGTYGELTLFIRTEVVLATTDCAPPQELVVDGVCNYDGSATFTVFNGGGPMDATRAQPYEITDGAGTVIEQGTIQLNTGETFTTTIVDVYGPLTFTSTGLSPLTANTDCAKPPALRGVASCTVNGGTRFVITNDGGPMGGPAYEEQPVTYTISLIPANVVGEEVGAEILQEGSLTLGEGESVEFEVTEAFGQIVFDASGGPAGRVQLNVSSICYQPPALQATGICVQNGSAEFTVTNTGGDMRLGNQTQPYEITDADGDVVQSGTLDLGPNASATFRVDGVYGPLMFTSSGISTVTANTECYKPSVLSSVGVCVENGSALFVVYNGGGDMTLNNQTQPYEVTDESGTVVLSGTLAIAENESLQIPVPDVYGTLTLTSAGLNPISVSTTCYEPPKLEASAICTENAAAEFSITNTGGDMSNGSQQVDYVIRTEFGLILEQGTLDLDTGATVTFTINRPGETIVFETADFSATVQTYCEGQVPPETPEPPTTTPVCGYTYETINGFPVVVMTNPELCNPDEAPKPEWVPVEVGPAVCPDWLLYHTNQTGDWEVFRLGELPDAPGAEPNISQGTGFRVYDMAPSKSPDANWAAFASNRDGNWEIYIGRTDGSFQQRVTYTIGATDLDPMWSPNGQHIAYESARDGNWEIYLVDVATGVETRLTNDGANDINPFWHPDGDKLLFQSDREDGVWQLYEFDITTMEVTKLSDGAGFDHDASYSFNGEMIVFRSYRDGAELSAVYVMNADGSDVRQISVPDGDATNAVFSPDDSVVAYQSDADGDLDIYVYEFSSEQTRLLTDNEIADYAPTWYCESTTIIWTSDITEDPNVFSVNALPIDEPAIDVLAEAAQLTTDPNADQYPENAPSEENASRQRSLPSDERR